MKENPENTLRLMEQTGYPIRQNNGQRIFGPPPDWEGPAPKDTGFYW